MKNVLRFVSHSYLFWVLFSLLNFSVFWIWLIPFVFPILLYEVLAKFSFLRGPFLLALGTSLLMLLVLAIAACLWVRHAAVPVVLAYLCNASFLFIFLHAAEHDKNAAIAVQLQHAKPECVRIQSLLSSIKNTGKEFQVDEHALYKAGGKTYYWSYSTMRFFEGNDRLDPNFPCR
ncbi:MAG TPA: hypothetical protein VGC21_12700 [Telluria sp.]|jgi:hypothetical protein